MPVQPYGVPTQVTIDGAHEAIHRGRSFTCGKRESLGDNDEMTLLIAPPTGKYPHVVVRARAEKLAFFDITVGGTSPSGGVALSKVNRVTGSSETASTVISTGKTGSNPISITGGTTVQSVLASGGNNAGGVSYDQEWVVSAWTYLFVKLTSRQASNDVAFDVDFYEF